MIKDLLACAISLMLAAPAIAGDRPGEKVAVSSGTSRKQLAYAQAERFALPLDVRTLDGRSLGSSAVIAAPRFAKQRFDLAPDDLDEPFDAIPRITETTADDGGRYAVSDTLSDYRKPRFRRSALGTMLTLRLDGETESPAFSVGGGGVAAVVWQAMPKS
ncbi:hypothetical protein [Sphingomonas xinjiangensis]|uniref:Uncharacterized protein n=1 Tax=Sphingomonas xinjiangensis TaxID=643568 RepID=A0A840YJY4_9SPHN|nr:hypothetical protein [Sphingomonas xinjiangensis]MBB5709190.1 hypothetical protein [Sphingomonas xinjiangensis]